jgi:hypothetical protein
MAIREYGSVVGIASLSRCPDLTGFHVLSPSVVLAQPVVGSILDIWLHRHHDDRTHGCRTGGPNYRCRSRPLYSAAIRMRRISPDCRARSGSIESRIQYLVRAVTVVSWRLKIRCSADLARAWVIGRYAARQVSTSALLRHSLALVRRRSAANYLFAESTDACSSPPRNMLCRTPSLKIKP